MPIRAAMPVPSITSKAGFSRFIASKRFFRLVQISTLLENGNSTALPNLERRVCIRFASLVPLPLVANQANFQIGLDRFIPAH